LGIKFIAWHKFLSLGLSSGRCSWRRQISPKYCHLVNWTKHTHRIWFWPIRSIMWMICY